MVFMDNQIPSVTALCLTRNRRELLPRAIQCFLHQSYENKKLLILADGEDISDLVPDDQRISLVTFPEESRPRLIGVKRNIGCAMVDTDLIAVFDDDDASGKHRLSDQIDRLVASGLSCTGYKSLRFKDGHQWWEYHGTHDWVAGTSLCFKRTWWEEHPFPQIGPHAHIGEDTDFAKTAYGAGQLVSSDGGDHLVATVWAGNTAKKDMTGPKWVRLSLPEPQWYVDLNARSLTACSAA